MFTSQSPSIRLFAFFCTILGFECLRSSLFGGVPMPPETHGGAMYAIPAELWSLAVIGQAAMLWWSACRRRLRVAMFAGLIGGVINIAIAIFAQDGAFGFLLSRGAAVIGFLHLAAGLAAFVETREARIRRVLRDVLHRLEGIE